MIWFNKIFFRGLITLLPVALTIYILYSAVIILENLLGSVLRQVIPIYIPGLGLLLTLVLIFLFGLLLNNFLTARLLGTFESALIQVPFIRTIYSPLKDLMNLFDRKGQQAQSVVLVSLFDGMQVMGVVTREKFRDLPFHQLTTNKVAVFLPFSYGLGGYTLLIPRDKITVIDIPIEKAMSLAVTGWVKSDNDKEPKDQSL
jgi:uncharacterized membrane protein